MPDDDVGTVLAPCVPSSPDKGFYDRMLNRTGSDSVRLRPPAINFRGEYVKGALGTGFDGDGLVYRCDADSGTHVLFLGGRDSGFSISLLSASSASSQNPSSHRRSSPKPSGSM